MNWSPADDLVVFERIESVTLVSADGETTLAEVPGWHSSLTQHALAQSSGHILRDEVRWRLNLSPAVNWMTVGGTLIDSNLVSWVILELRRSLQGEITRCRVGRLHAVDLEEVNVTIEAAIETPDTQGVVEQTWETIGTNVLAWLQPTTGEQGVTKGSVRNLQRATLLVLEELPRTHELPWRVVFAERIYRVEKILPATELGEPNVLELLLMDGSAAEVEA